MSATFMAFALGFVCGLGFAVWLVELEEILKRRYK